MASYPCSTGQKEIVNLAGRWFSGDMEPVKERVVQHLKLAQIIASKYFNIPGITREEAISEANAALVRASAAYDPSKGPFPPFAGTVIRNALNSLYQKQLKHVKMMVKSLDETVHGATKLGTQIGNLGQNVRDTKSDVIKEVQKRERIVKVIGSIKILNEKERFAVKCVAIGMKLSEIAEKLGVSRQAVYKTLITAFKKIKFSLTDLN